MLKSTLTFIIISLLTFQQTDAQELKFGKVSKKELQEKYYPSDSSASAAILYKKRRTTYEYVSNEGWVLITKIHERIKIYNKEGYDWATKKISLYKDGEDEKVSIKAYTFNLVGNKPLLNVNFFKSFSIILIALETLNLIGVVFFITPVSIFLFKTDIRDSSAL